MNNRIRELRIKHNLKQEELALHINTSQQTISRLERGEYVPTVDIIIDLANYFKVSVDYLLNLSDSKYLYEEKVSIQKFCIEDCDFIKEYMILNEDNQITIRLLIERLYSLQEKWQ